ncbi:hypothetical protein Pmani_033998 [Petrolisthes manimaculis]|uniref:Uncharacterized protein n=1 Tax=Petrolisthes manimaculis TaxID=1843537 RepID=A0AAE1NQ59_9EUCA|nr:hypothetical protein Pmani_033998 [Petrolisthes manimaculis]
MRNRGVKVRQRRDVAAARIKCSHWAGATGLAQEAEWENCKHWRPQWNWSGQVKRARERQALSLSPRPRCRVLV